MSFVPISADELDDRHALNARFEEIMRLVLPWRAVILWFGTPDTVPAGWAICDGQNGTPDMRGRFAVGAGGDYAVGAVGGESTHTLTVPELASHYHSIEYTSKWDGGPYIQGGVRSESGTVSTTSSESAGRSQPHNNMPPYFALYYIMKL